MEPIAETNFNLKIPLPTHSIVCGSTNSGKTSLVLRLLSNPDIFSPRPKRVLYYYDTWQDAYSITKDLLESYGIEMLFYKGIHGLSMAQFESSDKVGKGKGESIIVIDDFSLESSSSKDIAKMVTNIRHLHCSLFIILHFLFSKSEYSRIILQNVGFVFVLPSPRLSSQLKTFGQQLSMAAKLMAAYEDACFGPNRDEFPYLVIDLRAGTPSLFRLRCNIESDPQHVYV